MQTRTLGKDGPRVSAIGLGCMGMSAFYGAHDDNESRSTLHYALDRGINFLDTSDMYGPHTNERLVGSAIKGRRDNVFLATKFGIQLDANDPHLRHVNGRPEYVHASCDASLKRLGVDCIDLYYQHRIDANVPVEETVGAMAELVTAGKVRYLGLCEASAPTLERAHKVHPITALQSEYSLWTRDPENAVLAACKRLGIGFVPYSPLGRGFLTGAINKPEDFDADDFRRDNPRFQGDNFARNLYLVEQIKAMARDKGCSPAQLALAWVLAQGEYLVPIPGTRRINNLEENIAALNVTLTNSELASIDAAFPLGAASGTRYQESVMHLLAI
ncbi:aldo/keto reductase [Serratia sp. DD3]|uniref:aldo/keto reductase n=1 Tax=Serratia sp. DD3 TaxID=1410619 RepID=UPI0003C513BC|nr:aldo/keto reductase [Serratia sp. DD3]KEY56627.1 general stress protein 69 [Serratia sp. DD3]